MKVCFELNLPEDLEVYQQLMRAYVGRGAEALGVLAGEPGMTVQQSREMAPADPEPAPAKATRARKGKAKAEAPEPETIAPEAEPAPVEDDLFADGDEAPAADEDMFGGEQAPAAAAWYKSWDSMSEEDQKGLLWQRFQEFLDDRGAVEARSLLTKRNVAKLSLLPKADWYDFLMGLDDLMGR